MSVIDVHRGQGLVIVAGWGLLLVGIWRRAAGRGSGGLPRPDPRAGAAPYRLLFTWAALFIFGLGGGR